MFIIIIIITWATIKCYLLADWTLAIWWCSNNALQSPTSLLAPQRQTTPSAPPPKYEHPPPYAVDFTPGRDEVRLRGGVPDLSVAAREYFRAQTTPFNSYWSHIILACGVFFLCGFVLGAVAFVLAGLSTAFRVLRPIRGGTKSKPPPNFHRILILYWMSLWFEENSWDTQAYVL